MSDNTTIRNAVAEALGIHPDALGCFTVMDHESQPMVIVVHGQTDKGVFVAYLDKEKIEQRFKFKKVA